MDYRYLGRSALKVSPLCLGAMMFGGETDEATSARIIAKAFDQGVNFIDTADVYHAGRSEEIVGRAIAPHRDSWVVATKFGYPAGPDAGPNRQGQSRKWICQAVDASLKRLGTDYIDILYFHRAVTDAPLEEALRAVGDLIRQGKIRYYGLSNFRGWRIAEIVRIADRLGIDRPVASEPLYNLVDRTAEVEQLPAAAHYGIGVVPYSPLARGVLTGKYATDGQPPADSRAGRGDRRIQQTEWRPESLRIAQQVAAHAAARGTTSIAFALAWVLNNRAVSAAIAGPRTEAHWDSYVEALALELGPDDERFVDALVPPGHASTHGYTDPNYPVEGRKV
ncbi:aldo/keto reductase [Burkholderia pseudomultivorans]|uniref:L-glyceraldehyde 3-phosphate reductase n=1 Tax=Burkholderia pseudomultivorans TaxID=1207504 RepID=A0ABU2DYN2_9BURK|nr:aldo/keto reductase [Burkholderia pseudomultivorans]MDR8726952.1 L-glyceraldehyde 3-phosphate reductase [Burkholderia pseudomultivorans]MDR8735921.1 L-glyceraldehyde 3-phosphate reductase [Burkholderia pseudomultivorans]MDR8741897.1 L-glyceraldehyde 3-phosphate reductase [Burkholderia pseudomultivorans]MDR8752711.1 L-glyceraldehyde 3-phosphate reductase [Burkholderia pseudomultivorans]MDR8778491.1 L-glyceraldehyde 3-phosphate reductase [Burkholderia pseudomultivorans]